MKEISNKIKINNNKKIITIKIKIKFKMKLIKMIQNFGLKNLKKKTNQENKKNYSKIY